MNSTSDILHVIEQYPRLLEYVDLDDLNSAENKLNWLAELDAFRRHSMTVDMDPEMRLRCAIHEAGHAVAGVLFRDCGVGIATIDADYDLYRWAAAANKRSSVPRAMVTRGDEPEKALNPPDRLTMEAVSMLSGPIAEEAIYGYDQHTQEHAQHDIQSLNNMWLDLFGDVNIPGLADNQVEYALKFVVAHIHEIIDVAIALYQHHTLTGEQIADIIKQTGGRDDDTD